MGSPMIMPSRTIFSIFVSCRPTDISSTIVTRRTMDGNIPTSGWSQPRPEPSIFGMLMACWLIVWHTTRCLLPISLGAGLRMGQTNGNMKSPLRLVSQTKAVAQTLSCLILYSVILGDCSLWVSHSRSLLHFLTSFFLPTHVCMSPSMARLPPKRLQATPRMNLARC